jgi:hypothetical protein
LVVYPRHTPKAAFRNAVVAFGIVTFSLFRLSFLQEQMKELQREFAGLFEVAKPCPHTKGELAYVTFGSYSKWWAAPSLHQAHETYAAICKIDTPVYDPTEYHPRRPTALVHPSQSLERLRRRPRAQLEALPS